MRDKKAKRELALRNRKSYEEGFAKKCAEHGIDPDDLLSGLLHGKCEEGTVKAAQDSGLEKRAWLQYLFGGGEDDGTGSAWSAIGDSWPGKAIRNTGRGLYNVGEGIGLNRVGRWVAGDTWKNAGGNRYKNFVQYDDETERLTGQRPQDPYRDVKWQGTMSPKNFDRYSISDQQQMILDNQAPSAADYNAWRDAQDAKARESVLGTGRDVGWSNW